MRQLKPVLAGMARPRPIGLAVLALFLPGSVSSALAQIAVVNTGSLDDTANASSYTTSFDAGDGGNPADKLVVSAAAESAVAVSGITYNGISLTLVDGTKAGRNQGIWYLDQPFSGGAADLVVYGDGATHFSHMRLGIVSLSGSAPGVAVADGTAGTSVSLTIPVDDSFVDAGFGANADAAPIASAPLTQLLSVNSDSAAAGAGYVNGVPTGPASYSFTGNTLNAQVSAAVFVPASAAPVIVGTSPADDEVNVAPDVDLTVNFSEAVVTGSGSVVLKDASDDSTVESFDVATSPRLSVNGAELTIDPTSDLDPVGEYYVLIDAGAFADTSGGDAFAGIADPAVWNFAGDVPPSMVWLSPADDALNVAVDADLVVTFDQTILKGAGSITIHESDGTLVETLDVTSAKVTVNGADATIDPTAALDPLTEYYILIGPGVFEDGTGNTFAGISDPTAWSFTTMPGLDTVDGRLLWAIQENVSNPWPGISDPDNAPGVFSYAMACLYLDTNVSQANQLIIDFYTSNPVPDSDGIDYNGYFWQHIMWRLYHDPVMHARLTPQARTIIEDNMWLWLRTRSHLSEAQGTEWVSHGSENHDAMQKGSHLLCAQALKNVPAYGPDRVLADGSTIGEHAAAWTDYFQRYFIGRAKEGINAEIASPIYAKYSVGAYYNIMDFSDSPVLRDLAEKFITLYWADTASDWVSSGVRAGGEARCYKESYLRKGTSYSFEELLWAYGWHSGSGVVRTYPLIAATSSYRVPDIVTACATDTSRPDYLYTSRRWGRTSGSSGDNNYVTFDNGNSSLLRETWVTPDYAMGTITFDMNKDYLQILDQNRAMGVMFASGLNDRVMIFGKGASNAKSYADLSGVCRENCMVVQRDKNANSSGNGTLIFVEQGLWDNRVENSGWLFLTTGDAFCAIKPAGGGYTAAAAQSGYDLELGDMWAPIVMQLGQAVDYLDFNAFQASVMANALSYSGGTLDYTSEAGDTFTVYANSRTTPRVDGSTVELNPVKVYDSPYLSMVHGEDTATVSYTGFPDLALEFDLGLAVESLTPADGAGGVLRGTDLVAVFDDPIQAGTGFITLRKSSDDSVVESLNVSDPAQVAISGSQFTLDPVSDLDPDTGYYVTIEATAIEDLSGTPFIGLSSSTDWNFTTKGVGFAVVASGTDVDGSIDASAGGKTISIDAGATAELLVVGTTSELGTGSSFTATYDGNPMTLASGNGVNSNIFYLDLTGTAYAGGAADLVFAWDYTAGGDLGVGWVSAVAGLEAGESIELHGTAAIGGSASIDLTTTVGPTFNFVNFNANKTTGGASVDAPLTELYANSSFGSNAGGAGYEVNVAAGTHSYSWTIGGNERRIDAAAFAIVSGGGNDFSDWIAGYPGVGGQTDLDDDPDGDGHENGVENFFGTAPDEHSLGLVAGSLDAGTNTFTFSHPVNATPADDLTATYRWSTDLSTFHDDGVSNAAGTTTVTFTPGMPSGSEVTVEAAITGTVIPGRLFIDVEVAP